MNPERIQRIPKRDSKDQRKRKMIHGNGLCNPGLRKIEEAGITG
jgi:hypothetical protein